ncbi:CYTH and CHAD domain-containing protein [Phenylobacterium sp.]|uniref:CYTH and CHAD domain-containing protein n=1 Tax=Phenylobacterium sp. TaxID=1871053 RepID=UPI001214FEB7|nr:CYTH and CHAD domain-containing protein [Phenylobacterium sp.]THD62155.1 MAG: CYTH and CHAD domain-containing protein [Phenylobacterium sp.]
MAIKEVEEPAQEIELKFACRPEDLAAVLAAAPAGDDETRELISVYFDTPDLVLQRAGASLRVREYKGRRVQTVKRGRGMVREEHEAPIEGLAPDPALEPLPSLLPRGADLRPAFNVRISRRQRTLRYRGARIEIALDQGEVSGGEQKSPICEVELELKSGDPAALFALARELSAAAPLYLAFDSKAARGQALVAGEPAAARKTGQVTLSDGATVGAAFQAVARAALAQIAANAAVLRTAPAAEAVHQLRVGVRRVRSALSTFKPILDDDGLETLRADLKWLARSCDRARNLDVFADETLRPAEDGDAPPAGLPALRDCIDLARRAAWDQAAEACAAERFRALMIDATAWVETGDWRASPETQAPIRPFARRALKRHLRKLQKLGRTARGGDDVARHHLRIEAKKLRYAAEALIDLFGEKRAHRYLRHLKALQEALGTLNDLVTAEPLIAALALPSDAAFAAGELVGRKAARKPDLIVQAARAAHRLEAADPFWA